jgi:competence protein ComEA
MRLSHLLAASAVAALLAGPAFAQTATPPATTTQQPQRAAPTTPAAPTAPATTQSTRPTTPAGQAALVDINTATAAQLDGLPQIGSARAQAIITERGKGRFRDWADFERRMAGSAVNQQALAAIREKVRF